MKQITVKFTKAKGWLPTLMYTLCKHEYTHTAISVDGESFYSFTEAGFIRESKRFVWLKNHKPKYAYYQFDVEDEVVDAIQKEIDIYKQNQEIRYSKWMIVFAFLKLPISLKNRYTCSYFVADMLKKYQAFPLKRPPMVYLPNDLFLELRHCRQLI